MKIEIDIDEMFMPLKDLKPTEPCSLQQETSALEAISKALEPLDESSALRVIQFACFRYTQIFRDKADTCVKTAQIVEQINKAYEEAKLNLGGPREGAKG